MKLKDLFRRKSKTASSSQSSQPQLLPPPVSWSQSRSLRWPSPPSPPPRQLPPLPLPQPLPPIVRDPSPPLSPPPSYSFSPLPPPRRQSPPPAVSGPPPPHSRRRRSSPASSPLRVPSPPPPPLPQPSPPPLRQRRSLPLNMLGSSPNAPDTGWNRAEGKEESHSELGPKIPRRTPSNPAPPVNRNIPRYDPQPQTGQPRTAEAPLTWSWNGSTGTWVTVGGADPDGQTLFTGSPRPRRNSDPSPSLPPPPPLHEPRPLRPSPPLSQRRTFLTRDPPSSPPPRRPSPPMYQRRSLLTREAPLPPLPHSRPPRPLREPSPPPSPPFSPSPSLLPPPLDVDKPPQSLLFLPGPPWDPPAVGLTICPNCGNRPVAPNPATGKYFDYCSRTCAVRARNLKRRGQLDSLCEQCRQKPKLKKGNRVHSHCSLACAKLAANNGFISSNSGISTIYGNNNPAPQNTSSGGICRIPGCRSSVYIHPNGAINKYCTAIHKDWGKRGCVSCRLAPMTATSVLCEACHDYALNEAPVIIEVPKDHRNYKSVKSQFKQTWKHKTTCPDIRVIYKIIVPEASMDQYLQYVDSVEARGNFAAKGKSPGNENRRWHGTKRKCQLGDPGYTTFCTETDCALCCIINTSFDLKFFKSATGWGRFGHGIYTSATSSKSNDYSRNMGTNSELKALLLNKVVVGNGKKLTINNPSLTAPPAGFDSVLGEVGGTLNYDELVVYHNDAVRPSYLVMYKSL